jgi:hypothetical protein
MNLLPRLQLHLSGKALAFLVHYLERSSRLSSRLVVRKRCLLTLPRSLPI